MNTFGRISIALAIAALSSAGAVAQNTYTQYGSEDGWDIYVNEKTNGCLIAKGVDGDTQIQMGVDKTTDMRGYMALYTKKAAKVGPGEKLSVSFDIDGEKFSGEATGVEMKGFDGAIARFNNPNFIYDLAKKKSMTITPKGRDPIVVSLAGTNAALKALRACQEARG